MARMSILSKTEQELFENPPLLKISDLEVPLYSYSEAFSIRFRGSYR